MLLLFFCTLWLNGIPSYQFTKVFCLLKNIIGWFPNILGKFFFTFKMCVYSLFLRCLQLPYSYTFHYPTRDASLFWWASLNRSSLLNYLLFQYFFYVYVFVSTVSWTAFEIHSKLDKFPWVFAVDRMQGCNYWWGRGLTRPFFKNWKSVLTFEGENVLIKFIDGLSFLSEILLSEYLGEKMFLLRGFFSCAL